MGRRLIPILAAAPCWPCRLRSPPSPPDSWDGLIRVEAKRVAAVYLLQDADFRGYSKVMIDQPEVAFKKDWKRNYNMSQRSIGAKVGDEDVRKAIDRAKSSFVEALVEAYAEAGYQVVSEPGPDVLRVSTGDRQPRRRRARAVRLGAEAARSRRRPARPRWWWR